MNKDLLREIQDPDGELGLTFPEYLRSLKIQRYGETKRLQQVSLQLQTILRNYYEASQDLETIADLLEKRE
ncbi:hypothetical protein PL85_15995 [Vibrio anguillarum]|uniref:Uncharacterized protein n=4 Tax=Vibrio anguillarum TaxID=55601 RepID=A0ABR9ZCM3_VIBAN|nr:hypothetical protein [Vibrio anguillarum]MBF4218496.1 hypothetical protein [Vibrio anguillarum]MBF4222918.1 hypothetical protein [Vibrio anguillarum]MBF4227674.1 hypothetical protein [Vibrio anguillarum]MBF4232864.1 hypothetical protein [Vibrio anguillarum]MBF4237869.1 hypothetical protein [Vibrio anguillarum]